VRVSGIITGLLLASALAACGGSVQTTPITPASVVTATSSTNSVTTFPIASLDGISVTTVLPPTGAATLIQESLSLSPFAVTTNVAHPQLPQSRNALDATAVPLLYLKLSSEIPVTIDGLPGVTLILPQQSHQSPFGEFTYVPIAGFAGSDQFSYTVTATSPDASGTVISIPIHANISVLVSPLDPLVFELYGSPAVATPTSMP
jgi:hypothetical protein